MAPILNDDIQQLGDIVYLEIDDNGQVVFPEDNSPHKSESDDDFYESEKATMWVVEGSIIRPSTSLILQNKLKPGIYKVDINREFGLYCKQIKTTSDELFVFSDSKIIPLLNEINLFWDKAEAYAKDKLIHKRGILLEGYPGAGKSSIISLLSDEIIKRFGLVFKVSDPSNLKTYVDFVKNSFRFIEPNTPIITIIEDLENYTDDDVLLDFLDGKSNIDHNVIITTSNNTQQIPDAFLRPSRIDLRIEIPMPNEKIREEYFLNKSIDASIIDELVKSTDGFSLADLKEVYISVFLLDYSIEDAIKKISKVAPKKNYTTKSLKSNTLAI